MNYQTNTPAVGILKILVFVFSKIQRENKNTLLKNDCCYTINLSDKHRHSTVFEYEPVTRWK